MKEVCIGFLCLVGLFIACIFFNGIGFYNTHITLKNQIEAKQKENEVVFDTMWKKINQTVQVADKYKDGLKLILTAYTDGRNKGNNQLIMDWTKEAVPNFDSSVYKQLNNIIVGSREDFSKNQSILIDLSRQHNQFIQTFPNNLFANILNIKPIEIQIITSTNTQKTFETGLENEIGL